MCDRLRFVFDDRLPDDQVSTVVEKQNVERQIVEFVAVRLGPRVGRNGQQRDAKHDHHAGQHTQQELLHLVSRQSAWPSSENVWTVSVSRSMTRCASSSVRS